MSRVNAMMTETPVITVATGAVAMNTSVTAAEPSKLNSVTVHFSAAPTTSESFVITLDNIHGSAYDTILYSVNPSTVSATDIVYQPTQPLVLETGDIIKCTFTNTDTRTYGLRVALCTL